MPFRVSEPRRDGGDDDDNETVRLKHREPKARLDRSLPDVVLAV